MTEIKISFPPQGASDEVQPKAFYASPTNPAKKVPSTSNQHYHIHITHPIQTSLTYHSSEFETSTCLKFQFNIFYQVEQRSE